MHQRDRRAIGWGAVVVLPALLGVWGVRPYLDRRASLAADIATERGLLEREQQLLASQRTTEASVLSLTTALHTGEARLFTGSDELAATQQLASYVGDAARRHRVLIEQGETRPTSAAGGGLVAIEVSVRAAGDLEGVLGLLAELDGGPRLVEVRRLGIERAGNAGAEPSRETLSVGLILRGYAATRSAR